MDDCGSIMSVHNVKVMQSNVSVQYLGEFWHLIWLELLVCLISFL